MTQSTTAPNANEGLRVVKLVAENYKRLHAVEIEPDPAASTVTIAGRNAQGKSSVIDAIWSALAGTAAAKGTATTRPIRDGETNARVQVDLGDIVVTRTWTGDKTALKVESKDGARYQSPQKMLDELIGRLSFDPLAFASLAPKQQQAELLELVDLPFDPVAMAAQRRAEFDSRTVIGRDVKQLQGQLDSFAPVAADVPDELLSSVALLDRIRKNQVNAEAIATTQRDVTAARERVEALAVQLHNATKELADVEAYLDELPASLDADEAQDLERQLANVDEINELVRIKRDRAVVADRLSARKADYEAATKSIESLDVLKTDGLTAAVFPVDGLGFDDEGVMYHGVPFAQASAAERLRVSVAMAMALNPRVRVIRITDGSLLDSENLRLIEEMAGANGFQVWIERVDESGTVGVVIEDGAVKA